jgi:uncharacterized membrane protein YkgB
MADLERRSGRRLTRREREQRAYALTLATGGAGLVAVAGTVLAVLGIVGASLPVLAAIVTVVFLVLLRRTLGL